ncbi:MAG: nuclear transport factor 2 family protein [Mycobacteriales bacterium]
MSADVSAANAEFYAAFEAADIDRMSAIWDDLEDLVCVHPGWPPVSGRARVLRSWSVIMANTPYIQFFLTDVEVRLSGEVAVLTCAENPVTSVDDPAVLAGAVPCTATNVFRRRRGGWRLWVHHSSPVLPDAGSEGVRADGSL